MRFVEGVGIALGDAERDCPDTEGYQSGQDDECPCRVASAGASSLAICFDGGEEGRIACLRGARPVETADTPGGGFARVRWAAGRGFGMGSFGVGTADFRFGDDAVSA